MIVRGRRASFAISLDRAVVPALDEHVPSTRLTSPRLEPCPLVNLTETGQSRDGTLRLDLPALAA
jgi:hypothetical protein